MAYTKDEMDKIERDNLERYFAKKGNSITDVTDLYDEGLNQKQIATTLHSSPNRISETLRLLRPNDTSTSKRNRAAARKNNPKLDNFLKQPDSVLQYLIDSGFSKKKIKDMYGVSGIQVDDRLNSITPNLSTLNSRIKEYGDIDKGINPLRLLKDEQLERLLEHVRLEDLATIFKSSKSAITHFINDERKLNIPQSFKGLTYETKERLWLDSRFEGRKSLGSSMYKVYTDPNLLKFYILDRPDWSIDQLAQRFEISPSALRMQLNSFGLENILENRQVMTISTKESLVYTYIKGIYSGNITLHRRDIIAPYELDIYMPELNIGIEINATKTHSDKHLRETNRPVSSYHEKKQQLSRKAGVKLISLFDDNMDSNGWERTKYFLHDLIVGADTILFGRNTKFSEVVSLKEKANVRDLIDSWHLQGNVPAKRYFVLRNPKLTGKLESIVGIAAFGAYKGKTGKYELKRLVFRPNVQVRYGASKLIINAMRKMNLKELYSFSNNDMGWGTTYQKIGFEHVKHSAPTEWYVNPKDGTDSYGWMLNTSWGSNSGILFRVTDGESKGWNNKERSDYIENSLVHRYDAGKGYLAVHRTGNELWKLTLE